MEYTPPDPLLTADQAAAEVGLSIPGFWKSVAAGRLPQPLYPLARAPRWRRSDLHVALNATRATPRDAMAARRAAKLAAVRGAELSKAA
jgi:predicted DNA-binding transcriptional regulator AlpA